VIVRRVRPKPGSQLALLTLYGYHASITDRTGETLELEAADHRRDAKIENAIRGLKYGMELNHLPSGKFAANGAWLAVQVVAHCDGALDRPDRPGSWDRHAQSGKAERQCWRGQRMQRLALLGRLCARPGQRSWERAIRTTPGCFIGHRRRSRAQGDAH
jgi:hypothetical protein